MEVSLNVWCLFEDEGMLCADGQTGWYLMRNRHVQA
jgi:hypothetical protein